MKAFDDGERETEELMLHVMLHMNQADVQRKGYQLVEQEALACKLNKKCHFQVLSCFVVDFNPKFELPTFKDEQPGMITTHP